MQHFQSLTPMCGKHIGNELHAMHKALVNCTIDTGIGGSLIVHNNANNEAFLS